jgi:hypothetical protein
MEVGKMPAERKTNQSRRLTAAGLIAVTAATLLMMGWAILPNAAFASGTFTWGGNGFPNATCTPGQVQTMLWIFNDNGSAVPTGLTINGVAQAGSWQQQGGGTYHFTTSGAQFPPVEGATTFATYTGTLGTNTVLTLSGCNEGQTTTSTTTTTTTTTTPTTTTTAGGGGGGQTTTTTAPASTTTSATVAPTKIHKSTTTTDEVLATTVSQAKKLAFTGIEDVVPIGALALTLMTTGSGLLWAGSRRRRHDGSEDED